MLSSIGSTSQPSCEAVDPCEDTERDQPLHSPILSVHVARQSIRVRILKEEHLSSSQHGHLGCEAVDPCEDTERVDYQYQRCAKTRCEAVDPCEDTES